MTWRLAHSLEVLRTQVNAKWPNRSNHTQLSRLVSRIGNPDENECWPWIGGIRENGYGTYAVKRDGRWTQTTAHRKAYELFVGPIKEGNEVDHLCRNRKCVNPAHLEAVSLQENRRRRNEHKTHCSKGHLYTDDNTRIQHGSDGYDCRVCRICERKRHNVSAKRENYKGHEV